MAQKQYMVTVTIRVPIQARSQTQAEQRSELLAASAVDPLYNLTRPWVDNDNIDVESRIEEEYW